MPALKFILPDQEDQALAIDTIPYQIGAIDMSLSIAEIAGASGLAFEISAFSVGIGGAVVGQWFALGSGYAEAWEKVRSKREPWGFAYGVVMGSDGRSARDTYWYFGDKDPEGDYSDRTSGVVAQKAFNKGLRDGWVQGHVLNQNQRRLFWRDLVNRTGHKGEITGDDAKQWADGQWKSWYREMAIAFRKYHIQ